jgi:CRP/FNR family transcriptional regulator
MSGMSNPSWMTAFPALSVLPPAVQSRLATSSKVVELAEGSRIFGPGHAPDSFLLLLDGTVRVSQVSESGREIVLYRVRAGESCALTTACLMSYEDYQADGIAETDVKAVAIPRAVFDDLIATSREFRLFVFTAFSRRVTNLLRLIEDVAFSRFEVRLAQRLVALADADRRVTATHQDLANELGSAREVVSRQLTEFQRRGLIRVSRGSVEITDRVGLDLVAAQG